MTPRGDAGSGGDADGDLFATASSSGLPPVPAGAGATTIRAAMAEAERALLASDDERARDDDDDDDDDDDLSRDVRNDEAAARSAPALAPAPAAPLAPASSSFASRYELVRPVGAGSFGQVFLARRVADSAPVAVKRVTLDGMDAEARAETRNEVAVLEMLDHPNVVRYHEAAVEDGALHIVMEYLPRGDLAGVLRGGGGDEGGTLEGTLEGGTLEEGTLEGGTPPPPLPEREAMRYFAQIALGVAHLHDRGVLHRDLKCQNVFVDARDVVKIGDFGISKILTSRSGFCSTVVGTPYYLSPEMCTGERYDEKSDVWALGCILYELCHAGARAFEGRSLPALVMNILRGAYAPPSPRRLSPELRDLQARMLRRDPRRRPTAREILASPAVRPHAEGMEGADPAFFRDDPPRAPARTKVSRNTNDAPGRPRDPSSRPKPRPNPRPNPSFAPSPVARGRSAQRARRANFLERAAARAAEARAEARLAKEARRAARAEEEAATKARAAAHKKRVAGAGSRIDRRAMNPAFREPRARGTGEAPAIVVLAPSQKPKPQSHSPPRETYAKPTPGFSDEPEAPPDGDEGVSPDEELDEELPSSTTFLPTRPATLERAPRDEGLPFARSRSESEFPPRGRVERPDAAAVPGTYTPPFSASPPARASRRRDPVAFDVSVGPLRDERGGPRAKAAPEAAAAEEAAAEKESSSAEAHDGRARHLAHLRGHCIAALGVKLFSRAYRRAKFCAAAARAKGDPDAAVGDAAGLEALLGAQRADVAPLVELLVLLEEVRSAAVRGEDAGFEGFEGFEGVQGVQGVEGFDGEERNPEDSELAGLVAGVEGVGVR